jgi:hypothetical protein
MADGGQRAFLIRVFYDERRLFGAPLIILAFGLYVCGGWLLAPHLLGVPL